MPVDYVRCQNPKCNAKMLVNVGEKDCPHCQEGQLDWADENARQLDFLDVGTYFVVHEGSKIEHLINESRLFPKEE